MRPLVDLHDLFVVHPGEAGGVAALRGLSLTVADEELCVVLGPSGAGKSTLVRVLVGLERPSAGSARVAELDLVHAGRRQLDHYRRELLGYADQHYWRALAPGLTIGQLVALPLALRGVTKRARAARALSLLERVGLGDRVGARADELSGGEQQRVALCAALVHRPRLLVADEPTGELDAMAAKGVFGLLADLCREERATAVLVSHDPTSASIADRVVHVRDGRVSEEEIAEEAIVVVGRGGWLRVPEDALRGAGIANRARVTVTDEAVELRPAGEVVPAATRIPVASGTRGVEVCVTDVRCSYAGHAVIDDLDVTFEPGRLTTVTGPSGSGKSTLLRVLAGLDVPDSGSVRIGEVELSELDRGARARVRRELLGVVGQTALLVDALTAEENVRLTLALRGVAPAVADERATRALVAVGLTEAVGRPVSRLSAGERERVALARAVAAQPAVLVLDEPTARLDTMTTAAICGVLVDLAHVHGTTVICSTHDPLVVAAGDIEIPLVRTALPSPA